MRRQINWDDIKKAKEYFESKEYEEKVFDEQTLRFAELQLLANTYRERLERMALEEEQNFKKSLLNF